VLELPTSVLCREEGDRGVGGERERERERGREREGEGGSEGEVERERGGERELGLRWGLVGALSGLHMFGLEGYK
jgi:hypothetical protein